MNQIYSPLYLFKPYLLCVSVLVPPLIVFSSSFLGLGFYVTVLTTTILIFSTSFLVNFTKKTKLQVDEDDDHEDEVEEKPSLMNISDDATREADDDSGSEISDDDSGNMNLRPQKMIMIDDDDEEGLIEIEIPSMNESKLLPTFLPAESIFQQQELGGLLARMNEVNEEENLIEIDISMGSIICPTFEIEA